MPKNRLEAFSDGLIAIAITLLILEIHVPELGSGIDNHGMTLAILALIPNFAVYVISFLVCTVWWISHHTFIHDLRLVDRPLLWANNLFLMFIAFIPFPTGLLGHHPGQPIATAFYGAVCTLTGLSFTMLRWYAFARGRLMKTDIGESELRRRVHLSLLGPTLYLGGTICSFFFPLFAMCLYVAVPAYFALTNLGGSRS